MEKNAVSLSESSILEAYHDIMSAVPEKCQPCFKPQAFALREAHKVDDNEFDVASTKQKIAENLRWRCLGQVVIDVSCTNIKKICQFNSIRQIPTDPNLLALPD